MRQTIVFFFLISIASSANAYIGFGPGMTMIGAFFSLVLAVLAALLMVMILPLRIYLRKRRERKEPQQPPEAK